MVVSWLMVSWLVWRLGWRLVLLVVSWFDGWFDGGLMVDSLMFSLENV